MADMTTGDLALMRDNGMFGGGNGLLWFIGILIILGMFNGGGFGFNNNNGNYVTQAELTNGLNNQATQTQLQQIALSSANNNYETAQLIHAQSNEMMQQNNANLINAIQGFNSLGMQLTNQTNVLSSKVDMLGSQMNECCCSIKTMMLENRLQDAQTALNAANNALSNAAQSQYILSQMGHWTPNVTTAAAGA